MHINSLIAVLSWLLFVLIFGGEQSFTKSSSSYSNFEKPKCLSSPDMQSIRDSCILRKLILRGGCALSVADDSRSEDQDEVDEVATIVDSENDFWLQEAPERISIPDMEEDILKYWDDNAIFQRSLVTAREEGRKRWVFFDGPPFATGMPHYGHILAGTLKDVMTRCMSNLDGSKQAYLAVSRNLEKVSDKFQGKKLT